MGRRHTHRLRVRYGECDPQGVVFNAQYFAYFDVVLTDLFVSANQSPRMYDLYRKHLASWFAEGGGLFAAFRLASGSV